MATKTDETSRLSLKLLTGTDTSGKAIYKTVGFSNFNPVANDNVAVSIASGLAALQSHSLSTISRTNAYTLAD